ncbi:MAG: hypothetical protein EPO21_21590 [Chloroflexota bacterium]|nr:MAG: hypothetical protein EPO21_21590 [Chloroflexota bacterium]
MRLDFNAQVMTRHDVVAGHLERLAIDPQTRKLLGLVVHCGEHIGYDVVLPLYFLVSASADLIQLHISEERMDRLPGPTEGSENALSGMRVPHIRELPAPIGWPAHYAFTFPEALTHSTLPEGTIELTNSTTVHTRDGMIGTVAGVEVEKDGTIELLVVRIGTVHRRDVLVPIAWVQHLNAIEIELSRSSDEVRGVG